MDISHVYTRRRGDLGRQCLFSDRQAELLVDVLPDPSLGLRFTEDPPRDRALQAGRDMSEHHVSYSFYFLLSLFTFTVTHLQEAVYSFSEVI